MTIDTSPEAFLWLEDIYGEDALAWVAEQNARTSGMLEDDGFRDTASRILEVLDATDRIPMVTRHGEWLYNYWKDAGHPKGVWRRTTLDSYRSAETSWETVLDLDALAASEGADWVWGGAVVNDPDAQRALLRLSPDGGDAVTLREFDLVSKAFVQDGFVIPVAKTLFAMWVDGDTIHLATERGEDSLTTSSYPREALCLKRGQALADADVLMTVDSGHMMVSVQHDPTPGFERDVLADVVDFHHRQTFLRRDGENIAIDVPLDADVDFFREWLLVRPRESWKVGGADHAAGSLLAIGLESFLAGDGTFSEVFTPDASTSLSNWTATEHCLLLTLLQDVSSRVEVARYVDGAWSRTALQGAPELHTVSAEAFDPYSSDHYWLIVSGYATQTTLQLGEVDGAAPETVKTSPSYFDDRRFSVEQHFATSADGTRVPYFQVSPTGLELDGSNPTLLYGYGGFEISLTPAYNAAVGRGWLERGGTYVVANIRGGGEYGPTWHTAALQANRHRAYEDFSAVAKDLIARGVTSPEHLGCEGGSNGGLLVGNMLTTYPELFGAIVCEVPLLDMQRYTKLNAGYSWIAEYGDPDDPSQWAFIETFSPFHRLEQDRTYPPILFYTSTSDDRVGPVQARKMAARMQAMGIPDVWFYENRAGGHGAAADNAQLAHLRASAYEFLWRHLAK
jgi:prolyl oligopeptidase